MGNSLSTQIMVNVNLFQGTITHQFNKQNLKIITDNFKQKPVNLLVHGEGRLTFNRKIFGIIILAWLNCSTYLLPFLPSPFLATSSRHLFCLHAV